MPKSKCIVNKGMVRVHPDHPDPHTIEQAGNIIRSQGVVIFPAQCLYGVAADATDPQAVEKVFTIKQRPWHNPILVLVETPANIPPLVTDIPTTAKILMDTFWPGNITLVFNAAPTLSPLLTAHTNKIGIRVPAHPVARALVKAAGRPITGTSANISGQPGAFRTNDLAPSMVQQADLILDAGPVKGGTGSTIADITTDPVTIPREGAIPASAVQQALARHPDFPS